MQRPAVTAAVTTVEIIPHENPKVTGVVGQKENIPAVPANTQTPSPLTQEERRKRDSTTATKTIASGIKGNFYLIRFAPDLIQAISCQWQALRKQLLLQWPRLTSQEVDKAGPRRDRLAALIQNKYGIKARLAENYLRNFERVLPLM